MLLQDRFSRKLYGIGLESRQTNVLLDAFNTLFARARSDNVEQGPPEVNMDAEAGFTSNDFRDGLEAQGVTVRVKRPGREEKQALAQLDSAMSTFKKALFRYQRQAGDDGWSDHIDDAISYVNRKPMPYGRGTIRTRSKHPSSRTTCRTLTTRAASRRSRCSGRRRGTTA